MFAISSANDFCVYFRIRTPILPGLPQPNKQGADALAPGRAGWIGLSWTLIIVIHSKSECKNWLNVMLSSLDFFFPAMQYGLMVLAIRALGAVRPSATTRPHAGIYGTSVKEGSGQYYDKDKKHDLY